MSGELSADATQSCDLAIVGTGFASTLFLAEYLRRAPATRRVIVLERGRRDDHGWQIEHQRNSSAREDRAFVNRRPDKPWAFTLGFGGTSNRWWASTPRMLPADFELRSRYGVGVDWPLGYDELRPHYEQAEQLLAISGPSEHTPWPRDKPYPLPPHRLSAVDRVLARAQPQSFFAAPSARASQPHGSRPGCCASSICSLCPANAKFTIAAGLPEIYTDPRVELRFGAHVVGVDHAAGVATGLRYRQGRREHFVRADLVALGANALFNPHLLARSGLEHPALGRYLVEQSSLYVTALLDGIDNFGGGTSITGHGYHLYDGPHRSQRAALLMESRNDPHLRLEPGKWRQIARFKFIAESLPSADSRVVFDGDDPDRPQVQFAGHSSYTHDAFRSLPDRLAHVLAGLPIERVEWASQPGASEGHILGTARMSDHRDDGVVDRHQVHHELRNLFVLGGSSFPSCAPANPTLTICALSLWSASQYFRAAPP